MASLHRKGHHAAFTHPIREILSYYHLVCKHLTNVRLFFSPVSLKLTPALELGVEEGWRNDS